MDTKIKNALENSFEKYKSLQGGENASYIPYLSNVNPNLCSFTVVTTDGTVYSIGDDDYAFAIESISKVCTLALAMEELGPSAIREKIGDSPTGMSFNSVIAMELHEDKPLSPLVNAGAMATTSIIEAKDKEERWQKILAFQRKLMSEKVALSPDVNTSEQTTNFHNRAMAYLLYSANNIFSDPMDACEVYTRQCSTLVTSKDLAYMAATFANDGIHPITKEQVVAKENVPHILAEMTMEGLYEESGDFAYTVGLPGKSGVGGGMIAVVPGKMGIAAFSPPLNSFGNSLRSIHMIRDFAKAMNLNIYNP